MKSKLFLSIAMVAVTAVTIPQTSFAQTTYAGRANYGALKYSQSTAYHDYLMREVYQDNLTRENEFDAACQSKKAMQQYVKSVKERFTALAGEFPERTDTEGKVVGTMQGPGFKVEKIIYKSQPGRYVTAHLYLPESSDGKKLPACIEMCGHGLRGKGEVSSTAVQMVLNGIAVLVVDPIGQGERLQLIDAEGNANTRGVTTEHTLEGPAYNLVGSSLAAQEYWDNSRAIDYLCSRGDIDANKIGAYGFSGGGTQAAYLIGLDERVQCGCVGLFFSNRALTLETQGPSDACQWIPGEGASRIEIADMAIAAAPKPFIILDGKYDFVNHWGALRGYDELAKCYTVLGAPEKVSQYYAEDGHAVPSDVMEHLVSWFRQWLAGNKEVKITNVDWKGTDALCTSKGQVNLEFADAVSTMKRTEMQMDEMSASRKAFCAKPVGEIQAKIKQLLGLPAEFNDNIQFVPTGSSHQREYEEYRYQVNCEGQMPVAVVVWVPSAANENSAIEIHLHQQGKAWYLNDKNRLDGTSDGTIIVAADTRGIGEQEDPYTYNLSKYWNWEYRDAVTSLHIGRPILGQRVADVHTLVNFCTTADVLLSNGKPRKITVVADGIFGPVVMHAAVLDERIQSATLTNTLKTYRDYLQNPMQRDMYSNVVPGVLKYYDLPDLIKLSNGRVRVSD